MNSDNFNNPQNLALSDAYSTVSATLENPGIKKEIKNIKYGDFRSADPLLAAFLPKNLNYGITSPGTIHMETDCKGLDFMNTNDDYNKLTLGMCLGKFQDQYKIPEMAFNNLMNSLPYTFSALSKEEKQRYLSSLQAFINEEKVNDDDNKGNGKGNGKENFSQDSAENLESSKIDMNYILYIIIVVVIIVIFLLFIFKKKSSIY